MTARQVSQQEALVVRFLPDHVVDAVLSRIASGRGVLLRAAAVQKNGLDDKRNPSLFNVRDPLDASLDKSERIARPRLQNL